MQTIQNKWQRFALDFHGFPAVCRFRASHTKNRRHVLPSITVTDAEAGRRQALSEPSQGAPEIRLAIEIRLQVAFLAKKRSRKRRFRGLLVTRCPDPQRSKAPSSPAALKQRRYTRLQHSIPQDAERFHFPNGGIVETSVAWHCQPIHQVH